VCQKDVFNAAIIQELGIIPVEYKMQIKKLIEYHKIVMMTKKTLKNKLSKTEQIGLINLLVNETQNFIVFR